MRPCLAGYREGRNLSHMSSKVTFNLLAERPREIPRVARWWCDEWGLPSRHSSFEEYVQELQSLVPGTPPIHVLAM
jgi:hypothetical protein